jgi:sigma-E factor negative regulatory protein RseA
MKMSKETREHLSALVDGEISMETSRFLVRRLGADEELNATWTRYHLIRDCLRHQDGSIAGQGLSARVSQALENEGAIESPRVFPTRWIKPAAGFAIAASVALMAIVAVGPGIPGVSPTGSELADKAPVESFVSPQSFNPAPISSQVSYSGSANARMNPYLLRHYQAVGSSGGKGFVTFVPIIITGSKTAAEPGNGETTAESEKPGDEETRLQ